MAGYVCGIICKEPDYMVSFLVDSVFFKGWQVATSEYNAYSLIVY